MLSSRAQVLVPEWCRELREDSALIDKLFRDVNRAVNMLHDVERGKIVNMQHMSVPMSDSQRNDKREKSAEEAVDAAAQRRYIVRDLRERVDADLHLIVVVADLASHHADVLMSHDAASSLPFSDGEMGQVEEVELFLEGGELLVDVETKEQGEHVMPYNAFASSVYVFVARTVEEEVNIGNDKTKEVVDNNAVANNDISSPYILDDKTYVTVTYKGEQWQCRQINDIDNVPLLIASSDILDALVSRQMQGGDLRFTDAAAEAMSR